ncbi:protein suppressor of npr1-1, partial [Quercus suber]
VLNVPLILLKEPVLKQNFVSVTYVDLSEFDLIMKIPDLSMTPNLKQLILNECTNLVEIDDSVGRLDKLEKLDLFFCTELETLPNCLTMKSLNFFSLEACQRIKKFPNILHEMKGVEYLHLQGNYTNELPPSFGNLIGLKDLEVAPDSGEAHLPGSIYNLQSIEKLELWGDIIFPKNVEIDRQPMCNSLGCSSKYVFPMLKQLQLNCCEICSEIEFILNYCCPVTLEELKIYDSKVVTLPESMSRCERLHTLIIRDCDEFREIKRLPHSIRHVDVAHCPSLDSQSLFQLLPEIRGLPPSLPHSSTMPPIWQNHLCEYSFEVTGDENDIPNWFSHQREGNLISFSIGPEFPTIALCIAFGIQDSDCYFDYYVFISINGSERTFEGKFIHTNRSFGHLCISCRPQSSLQELFRDLQLTDRNHVEILCETFIPSFAPRENIAPIVERIGVHVECNCPPPQNLNIFQDINRQLSLQSGLGLPMHTENGSDLGSAFDSSNVDGFNLGSSSVAQPVTSQSEEVSDGDAMCNADFDNEDPNLMIDAEKDDCKSSKRHSYCVSGEENDQSFANNELDEREQSDATAYKYRGSHISDLCLIYGNESRNGRSSCLDMKMEVNNNALWMGLMITWDMQYPARDLSMFSKFSEIIKGEIQEAPEERP